MSGRTLIDLANDCYKNYVGTQESLTVACLDSLIMLYHFSSQNAKKKMYGCTEAFLADAKWILHNCIIYNGGEWLR